MSSNLSIVFHYVIDFFMWPKKSLTNSGSQKYSLVLLLVNRSYIGLAHRVVRSIIYFELSCVYIKLGLIFCLLALFFVFFHMDIQMFLYNVLKRLSFHHKIALASLLIIKCLYMCQSISGLPFLIYLPIYSYDYTNIILDYYRFIMS